MSSPALPHLTACLFDLDGTLVDTLGDFEAALGAMLEAHGRARVSRAQIARMVGRGTPALIAAALALEPDAPPLDAEAAQALYLQHYFRINGTHARVYAGAAEALAALHARGLPLACVTNKPQEAPVRCWRKRGWRRFSHTSSAARALRAASPTHCPS